MSKHVFPDLSAMDIYDLSQMIAALYRDDHGWRILIQVVDRSQGMNISEVSGQALWTAVQEDGHEDSHAADKMEGAGVATTWVLKPNAYGRLLTPEERGQMAEIRGQLMEDRYTDIFANPMKLKPRGRRQRLMGVQ